VSEGWLYRRDDGDPARADFVRFYELDPLDRFLIETFRGADLEPLPGGPGCRTSPEIPGSFREDPA
jgi:hypothetical protein